MDGEVYLINEAHVVRTRGLAQLTVYDPEFAKRRVITVS